LNGTISDFCRTDNARRAVVKPARGQKWRYGTSKLYLSDYLDATPWLKRSENVIISCRKLNNCAAVIYTNIALTVSHSRQTAVDTVTSIIRLRTTTEQQDIPVTSDVECGCSNVTTKFCTERVATSNDSTTAFSHSNNIRDRYNSVRHKQIHNCSKLSYIP